MPPPPRKPRLAALATFLLLPSFACAVPVAVNDNYSINEDAILSTIGAGVFSTNFEPAANVLAGGTWSFLDRIKNAQNGQTPDTYPVDGAARGWKALAFDTATSSVGPWGTGALPLQGGGILGFPGAPDTLTGYSVPSTAPYNITTYLFRKSFTLDAATAAVSAWQVSHLVDDAAIFYVNGTEVHRVRFDPATNYTPAGTLTTNTSTNATLPDENGYTTDAVAIPAGLLIAGTNIFSVEVHQAGGASYASSDVGLDVRFIPGTSINGGFTYADNTSVYPGAGGVTNRASAASGNLNTTDGNPTSALEVALIRNNLDVENGLGVSGGWQRTFNLAGAATVRVSVAARVRMLGGMETDEFGEARLKVDGTYYGVALNTSLIHLVGPNATNLGNNEVTDPGWPAGPFVFDIPLATGSHMLSLEGVATYPSAPGENVRVLFDNVIVSQISGGTSVLVNDTGGAVTAQLATGPAQGTLSLGPDGNFIYTPTGNYFGSDSFTYRALDAASAVSNTATVSITVNPVNDAPVAMADSYSTNAGQTLTVNAATGVLVNDTDIDNTPGQLSAAVVTNPPANQGTLTLNASGSFTFVPAAGFIGPASFVYRVNDGAANSNAVTVAINVVNIGNAPVANDESYTAALNSPLVVTALVPATVTDDLIPFTAANWKYLDDGSDQGTAWQAPSFPETGWKTGAAELGYGDVPADEATIVEDNPTPGYNAGDTNRYVTTYFRRTFNVAERYNITAVTLSLKYDDSGAAYLNGNEAARTFNLAAGAAYDTLATQSQENIIADFPQALSILQDGVNTVAAEVHQNLVTSSDISFDLRLRATRNLPAGVLANDTDVDPGTTLTVSTNTNPAHGALSLNANGTFAYTPANGYIGPDSFTYRCTDGAMLSNIATVNLTVVSGPNVRPVASPDTYAATEEVTLSVNAGTGVLANDTDADGDSRTAVIVTPPASGSFTLNSDGSFSFTPALNFAGPITFTYTANDAGGPSAPATVTLNVANVNDPPVAVIDLYATDPGVTLIISAAGVLTNDTDADAGTTLTAAVVTPPAQGTLTLNANGSLNYAPAAGFTGIVTFTYRAYDGTINSNNATVTIKINGRPVAIANTYAATEDAQLSISAPGILANDTDPENDPLTAQLTTNVSNGTLSLSANGGFTYLPAQNFNGTDSFTYKAFDGARDSVTAVTVTLNVAAVNDAPTAGNDSYSSALNTMLTIPAATGLLGNDSDIDAQTITAVLNSPPASGVLGLNPDGSFTYTPATGFSGIVTFTYRATDGSLFSPVTTVSINVGIDLTKVVLNEIHFHPVSLSAGDEFIEIYNGNPGGIDASGWQFNAGVTYTIPAGTTIAAGGFLVVAANPTQFTATFGSVALLRGPWTGELSNGGEKVRLLTAAGVQVDEVEYADEGDWALRYQANIAGQTSWEWYTRSDAGGSSLELINPGLSNKNGQNWSWSTASPTPGNANSIAAANIAPLLSDLDHRPKIPRSNEPVTVTVNVDDESLTPPAVSLFWRVSVASPAAFTSAAMFDDGLHGDGTANDGEFGAVIPAQANGAVIEFYVSATDAGAKTRTWPAPGLNLAQTAYIQSCNAFYQVDEEVWGNHYPIYRLIGTAADVSLFLGGWDRQSDAQMNLTFVSKQGTDIDVRYRCGLRVRGAGSRGNSVNNWRLNIPKDDNWNGETEANLNVWHPHLGDLGSKMMECAGLVHERSWPVQVRLNATNRALSNSAYSGGYFIHLQPTGSEYLNEMRPNDSGGNLYKKDRPHQDWTVHEATPGGPPSPAGYLADGWTKSVNEDLNDWNDLHNLFKVFTNANPTVVQMESVMNTEYWLRWQAFQTIVNHNETNLSNGSNDDYSLYRGVLDPRMIPLAHDFDTVWGDGGNTSSLDPTSPTDTVYQTNSDFGNPGEVIPAVQILFTNPVMNQRFKAHLVNLLNTVFLPSTFNPMVDSVLGDWTGPTAAYGVPVVKRDAIKSFNSQRRTHILQTVLAYSVANVPPAALTVTTSLPAVSGYPQTTTANSSGLSGTVDSSRVQKVRVNATDIFPDNFQSIGGGEGANGVAPWSAGTAVVLQPGLNHLTVSALGPNDAVIATQTIDLWFDDGGVQAISSIAGNTTWTAAGGPYRVTANLTIDNETLTIEPGATVYLASAISLNVSGTGRILAEGTANAPIRFMREPGLAAKWGRVNISGSSVESRLAYVTIDGSGTAPAINLSNSIGFFDHIDFANITTQFFSTVSSSFLFQNSNFPATTAVESTHGNGIPATGYAIFRGNTFGSTTGLNDLIDFTGGQRPGAILQVLDNVFLGASDDVLDLDGTDAHIEGNVFMNVHQQTAGGDTSSGISGGLDGANTSEITIVRNLFYNCDHAILAKEGNFYTVVNNTIVSINNTGSATGSTAAAFNFHEPARAGVTPALGMYIDGNIVFNCPQVFENAASATGTITANGNIFPATISAPVTGTGNLTSDPMLTGFSGITAANIHALFALQSGSPADCTGPNGLDRGAIVPAGASISGEPIAHQPAQSAVLTISGPGIISYKYSLDGGPFGAEMPVATSVTLTGLTPGTHSIRAIGKSSAAVWQSEAAATQSLTWTVSTAAQPVIINEVLADNVNAWPVGSLRPDVIELRNLSGSVINMAGWSISDDQISLTKPPKHVFPAGTAIPAGGYLLLTTDTLGFNLDADGDEVWLYSGSAFGAPLLDSIAFGFQITDKSLSRVCNDRHWALSEFTPAAANATTPLTAPTGLRINEWLGSNDFIVANDFLEIYNAFTLPVELSGLVVTDDAINFPAQHVIAPHSFIGPNGFVRFIADNDPAAGANHLSFSISKLREGLTILSGGTVLDHVMSAPQLEDVSQGRTTDGSSVISFFMLPTPGYSNGTNLTAQQLLMDNLRITEMMYNPPGGSTAPEYIELKNISATQTLDLSSIQFVNGITFQFAPGTMLAPGAFIVISSAPQAIFLATYPGAPYGGTYTGRLDNSGERVRMEIDGYQLGILDFTFSDAWYPKTDGQGAALEIINPLAARGTWNDKPSWRATASNPGFNGIFAVLAGSDASVCLPAFAMLEGNLTYGSQNPGGVTLQWSKVGGPGTVTFVSPNAESTSASFSVLGTYTLRLTATGSVAVFDEMIVSAAEGYDAWAVRTLNSADPLITGMLRDPDKDGLFNLLEFALGLSPTSGSMTGLPVASTSGGLLSINYQRYTGCDMTYIAEVSADLVTWSSNTVTESMTSSAGTIQSWTATDTTPISGTSRRYMRVRVTSP